MMVKTANVFVNIPVKSIAKAYSYVIPESFSFIGIGWRVLVPFGGRKVEGFIVEIVEREDIQKLKSIEDLVDHEPWFTAEMIQISYWIADYYLCSVAEAMRLFMPGKSGSKITAVYRAATDQSDALGMLTTAAQNIVQYITIHPNTALTALCKEFPDHDVVGIIRVLLRQNMIMKDYSTKKTAIAKWERYFSLSHAIAAEDLQQFVKKPAQKKLLERLHGGVEVAARELKKENFSAHTLQETLKSGFVNVNSRQVLRDSYQYIENEKNVNLALTAEQRAALGSIQPMINRAAYQVFLLHGITGSGKTQVYIEAVQTVRRYGKKAIVLVPEIALTGQMIERFKAYFPAEVIVMHSRLSISERNDAILKIRRNEAAVVIGARSAIFTPVDDLGIIIMDEEHDSSYKQDESPRYHTRDIAMQLAKIHQAVLILGSATPSVESFAAAEAGHYQLLTLKRRVGDIPLPLVRVVDMRNELRLGRRNIISQLLQELIATTISRGEQVIILLNRRGFSTFVMCRECGHVISCPQCTLPLVYHKNGSLQCHFCDVGAEVPDICPKCASRYIKYFGSGTERLETELAKLFPAARMIRMDRDTTGKKFAHTQILQDFSAGYYDILLGTQMVAKGHDIQNVTAVGIISADSSLNLPDFRAAERCFSLITQAAGRAGRGNLQGRVVVQTYNPEHYAVACGAHHDYLKFYQEEIILRKQLLYPPYSDLIKIVVQHIEETQAAAAADQLIRLLKEKFPAGDAQFFGPMPAAVPRLREWYRYTVLIKARDIAEIKKFLKNSEIYLRMDLIIDVNPLNVM